MDALEQPTEDVHVRARRRRCADAFRPVAEKVSLTPEPEVDRARLGEAAHLREDPVQGSELRLAVHGLHAKGAPFVHVAHAALRRVELNGQGIWEVGVGSDEVGAEERPAIPLLHGPIPVAPLTLREEVEEARVDVAKGNEIVGIHQGLVIVSEPRERASEETRSLEGVRVVHDLPFTNRQAAQVLTRHDRAGKDHEQIPAEGTSPSGLVDRDVLPYVAGVADGSREIPRIRRDVGRHPEVGRLVDIAIENRDLHGERTMATAR